MALPFALRWEVSSLRTSQGSFVEVAQVRPVLQDRPGEWWVERPLPDLKPAHLARVRRRWWLASQLTSVVWPELIDAGEDNGAPWAVLASPGRRTDGAFPFPDAQLALKAARGLALGVAEAEGILSLYCASPHLSVRASLLGRDGSGRLRLHLAALDPEPDFGFPLTPSTWMWTAEELFGQPESARSNVFALGWLLTLMLTGRSPFQVAGEGLTQKATREAVRPLVAAGKFSFALPEPLKAVEPVLRRALAANPLQRFPNAAAFAEALEPMAPGAPQSRRLEDQQLALPVPPLDPRFEVINPALDARLLNAGDESPTWEALAEELEAVHSPRAKLMRGDQSAAAELTPALTGEKLTVTWRHGYVRTLTAEPAGKPVEESEARILELTALLQHPSLHFVDELILAGPRAHARSWHEALQRFAPPVLRLVTTNCIAANDGYAVQLAFRAPRWAWAWGQAAPEGIFKRLFGR